MSLGSGACRPYVDWQIGRTSRSDWRELRRFPLPLIDTYGVAGSTYTRSGIHGTVLQLPLWLPLLILLIPTLLLWRRDRRKPRPGFCRVCDYDLTGNTTGRSPECGSPCEPTAAGATPRAG